MKEFERGASDLKSTTLTIRPPSTFDLKIYLNYYDYAEDTFEKNGMWKFWANQDIPELTKILAPIEKHKALFCNPIFL